MPTVSIKRTPPLPEGEYGGVIEKVASGFTKAGDQKFTYNIRMKDGRIIKDNLYFSENVSWRIEQICKAANLILPENGNPFVLTTDDLEGRTVHFAVKYNPGEGGRIYVNVNFHTLSYALQQNPALAGLYPPHVPRKLREVPPEDLPTDGVTASPGTAPVPSSVSGSTNVAVGVEEAEDDTLTPEEYAQALEQAKKNKAVAVGKTVA